MRPDELSQVEERPPPQVMLETDLPSHSVDCHVLSLDTVTTQTKLTSGLLVYNLDNLPYVCAAVEL